MKKANLVVKSAVVEMGRAGNGLLGGKVKNLTVPSGSTPGLVVGLVALSLVSGLGGGVTSALAGPGIRSVRGPGEISQNPDDYDLRKAQAIAAQTSVDAERTVRDFDYANDRFRNSDRDFRMIQDQQGRTVRELGQAQGQLDGALQRRVQIDQQIKNITAEGAKVSQQLPAAQTAVDVEKVNSAKVRAAVDQALAHQKEVTQDIQPLVDRLEYLKNFSNYRAKELRDANDAVAMHTKRVVDGKAQSAAAAKEKAAREKDRAQVQADRDKAIAIGDDAARAVADTRIAELAAQIDALVQKIDQADAAAIFGQRDLDIAIFSRDASQRQIAVEQDDIKAKTAELNKAKADMAAAKVAVDQARAAATAADQRLTQANAQLAQLTKRKDDLAKQATAASLEGQRIDRDLPGLQGRVAALRSERDGRQPSLDRALQRAQADAGEMERARRAADRMGRIAADTAARVQQVQDTIARGLDDALRTGDTLARTAARQSADVLVGRRSSIQSAALAVMSDALARESGSSVLPRAAQSVIAVDRARVAARSVLSVRYPTAQIQDQFEAAFVQSFEAETQLATFDIVQRLIRTAGSSATVRAAICGRGFCAVAATELATDGSGVQHTVAVGVAAGALGASPILEVRVTQLSADLRVAQTSQVFKTVDVTGAGGSTIHLDAVTAQGARSGSALSGGLVRIDLLTDSGVAGSLDIQL